MFQQVRTAPHHKVRTIVATTIWIALAFQAVGVHATTLSLAPANATQNTLEGTITAAVFFMNTETTTASGSIEVDLTHDIVNSNAVVTEIEFTGGQVDLTDVSFTILGQPVNFTDIGGTMDTLVTPSTVSGTTFDATDHQFTMNQGMIDSPLRERDLSMEPFDVLGSGDGIVVLLETSRTPLAVTYETSVTLPIVFSGRIADTNNGDPVNVDFDLNGTLVAVGSWTVDLLLSGDFDKDGDLDGADVDSLVANVAGMSGDPVFDLTGDGELDVADLQEWLLLAGAQNLASGNPYLPGDANLDGSVDGLDFVAWNSSKFTSTAAWTSGDFNADGLVNGQDFLTWNSHKFTAADGRKGAPAVPAPSSASLFLIAAGLFGIRLRRRQAMPTN